MKKVLIASDKYKGSMSAYEVCSCLRQAISMCNSTLKIDTLPLADGGDGTLDVLQDCLDLRQIDVPTQDPLGRPISSYYLSHKDTAYIELAQASGIRLLQPAEYNIFKTNTIGTGILMQHAIMHGHSQIVLSIGGSCSNDMGFGILHALGFSFCDANGNTLLPCGENLWDIESILSPESFLPIELTILCDVSNPLYGNNGAAYVYGPQKGATNAQVEVLDSAMHKIAVMIVRRNAKDISSLVGGGAAGGVAAGLYGLLAKVTLQSGFDYLSNVLDLEKHIASADLVISGEGKLDDQSFEGKVVGKMRALCEKYNKPLLLVVGASDVNPELLGTMGGVERVYAMLDHARDVQDSMEHGPRFLKIMGAEIYNRYLKPK